MFTSVCMQETLYFCPVVDTQKNRFMLYMSQRNDKEQKCPSKARATFSESCEQLICFQNLQEGTIYFKTVRGCFFYLSTFRIQNYLLKKKKHYKLSP